MLPFLVQSSKANSALTVLNLSINEVGDAGAVALAEALKAMVATCSHEVRWRRVRVFLKMEAKAI